MSSRESNLRLLVVDDDDLVMKSLELVVPSQWTLIPARSARDIEGDQFDAAFVDLHLTGDVTKAEGLQVIKQLSTRDPRLEVVAISGNLDRGLMESCLKMGASRFLAKPLSPEETNLVLGKIEALLLLRNTSTRSPEATQWVGRSPASEFVRRQIARLKGESGPILIEGETGTGKEIVSRLLNSQERRGPFVQLNVAAVPDALFESELFGHVRGAFTGADQNKMGLAEAAHGGDLFLDEIEALSMQAQVKLLRFLESGELRRVGAKDNIRVKTRVIAATNQPLEELVRKEKFREDLLWRLGGKRVKLPPLRERPEDLDDLVTFFLEQERPRRNKSIAPEAMAALRAYNWPGNVRELRRVLEQVSLVSPLPIIRTEDILAVLRPAAPSLDSSKLDLSKGLTPLVEEFEKHVIREGLKSTRDVDETARLLKISRSSMYKKIKDYDIDTSELQ
ncbi:MAG TPA: sigma-54 dependent transcriptional regulator [Bdellovibrionales bacterium]|nr:sigma-54 dependent transcriptional regulator [Bdellovibrionales bacterium]